MKQAHSPKLFELGSYKQICAPASAKALVILLEVCVYGGGGVDQAGLCPFSPLGFANPSDPRP